MGDPATLALLDTSLQELTGGWELYHYQVSGTTAGQIAPTQELGQALADTSGIEGCLTISAKMPTHRNLVVFPQKLLPSSLLSTELNGVLHRIPSPT